MAVFSKRTIFFVTDEIPHPKGQFLKRGQKLGSARVEAKL
jgi:hypothetical protein